MEIKFSVDEGKILKMVLKEGLSEKEIAVKLRYEAKCIAARMIEAKVKEYFQKNKVLKPLKLVVDKVFQGELKARVFKAIDEEVSGVDWTCVLADAVSEQLNIKMNVNVLRK